MKIAHIAVLSTLVFLASSSGATKIMLMAQDPDFFSKYGFSNAMLMAFGAVQFIGGVMIVFAPTRFWGAASVAATFAISLVLLAIEGSIGFAIVACVTLVLLGLVMQQGRAR